jgi:hypothetical protein
VLDLNLMVQNGDMRDVEVDCNRQFVVQFTMQCDDSTQHRLQDMTSLHFILFSFNKNRSIFFSFVFWSLKKRLMLNLFANHFVLNMNQKYNNHSSSN